MKLQNFVEKTAVFLFEYFKIGMHNTFLFYPSKTLCQILPLVRLALEIYYFSYSVVVYGQCQSTNCDFEHFVSWTSSSSRIRARIINLIGNVLNTNPSTTSNDLDSLSSKSSINPLQLDTVFFLSPTFRCRNSYISQLLILLICLVEFLYFIFWFLYIHRFYHCMLHTSVFTVFHCSHFYP